MKLKINQNLKQKLTFNKILLTGISLFILVAIGALVINVGNWKAGLAGAGKDYETTQSGKWQGAFNWQKSKGKGGGFPNKSSENATIDGHTIDMKKAQSINNLSFQKQGTLNIKNNKTLKVNGTLDLQNGSIDASGGDLVLEQGANIENMNDTNFTGSYSVKNGNGIIDSSVFQLNASGGVAKISVHDFQNNSCDFSVSYVEKDPYQKVSSNFKAGSSLSYISRQEYFKVTRNGCPNSAKITLFWDQNTPTHLDNQPSKSKLTIAHYDGSVWKAETPSKTSGSITGSGYITSNSISGFSPFTFGSTSSSNPLPVELIGFNANAINGGSKLSWKTASETNNSHFEVQRRTADSDFKAIGKVDGNGTTTQQNEYNFTDNHQISGKIYYRLKQVDHDGSFEYSDVKFVNSENEKPDKQSLTIQKVSPNPFQSSFNLVYKLANDVTVTVTLRNMQGNVLTRQTVKSTSGKNEFHYTGGNDLSKGYYILTLESGDQKATKKLIKQ